MEARSYENKGNDRKKNAIKTQSRNDGIGTYRVQTVSKTDVIKPMKPTRYIQDLD